MSEPNDPFEARLRRLVADATDDAPAPPTPGEMMQAPRPATADVSRPTRKWVAGGAIGLVAAAVIALVVVPRDDDDALRPVDTVPATAPDPTIDTTGSTVPGSDEPELVPPTTMSPTPATVAATDPTTSDPTTSEPPATVPSTPIPPTVIAALDADGDAVLISADGGSSIELFDGPDPDAPAPEEGPGPNVVDSIALSLDGETAYVGFCCEPIAGSLLSGPPTAIGGQPRFGYAPSISPDGRLLAIGQIAGPATAVYEAATWQQLDVAVLSDEVGTYSPYDTTWLDDSRVVGLGILPGDDGGDWVAIPMVVDGDEVTVGEMLNVNELLPANDDGTPIAHELVRLAGRVDDDNFAVHVPGRTDAIAVEFRLDGVTVGAPVAGDTVLDGVGEPARSIWYQPDGRAIWVGEDGVLHRGDQVIDGNYLWARPTGASTFDASPPPTLDALAAIDLEEASLFGYSYGTRVPADVVTTNVSAVLGTPTWGTGWQPNDLDQRPCNGDRFRTVWWDDVRITFDDDPELGERVAEWSVGDPDVYRQAPIGELPPATSPSGVSTDPGDVGVGSSRADALAAAGDVGRMVQDEGDQIFVTGAVVTGFLVEGDVVTGIGSGRLDCNVGNDL